MNLIFEIVYIFFIKFALINCQDCSKESKNKGVGERNAAYLEILSYKVETEIQLRYSETSVTAILQNCHIYNTAYYGYQIVIPQSAFLLAFHYFTINIETKLIRGRITGKSSEVREPVKMWVRNANVFTADLVIPPLTEIQVYVGYAEVLDRNLGYYQQSTYIIPEILSRAKSLFVSTKIDETSEIKFLRLPFNGENATVLPLSSNSTRVIWTSKVNQERNERCSVVQYTVQYDLAISSDTADSEKGGKGNSSGNGGKGALGDGAFGDGAFGDGAFGDGAFGDGAFGDGALGGGALGGGALGDGTQGSGRHREGAMRRTDGVNGSHVFEDNGNGTNKKGTHGNGGGALKNGVVQGNEGIGGTNGDRGGANKLASGQGKGGYNRMGNETRLDGFRGNQSTSTTHTNGSKFDHDGVKANKGDLLAYSGDIIVIDNYLFHFFVPVGLKPLKKHVVFIQDISGSMTGEKLQQMKRAMRKTLTDLKTDDQFNIVTFAGEVKHWSSLNSTIEATPTNVNLANDYVDNLRAYGRTALRAALLEAFKLVNSIEQHNNLPDNVRTLMIVLTDGQPTYSNSSQILEDVRNANSNFSVPIHTFGFGKEADMDFLNRLALQNSGLSRHIFEGSDAAEQLKNFYGELSTSVLTDVKIEYSSPGFEVAGLSITNFTTIHGGQEIKVAGKIIPKVAGKRGPFKLTVIIKGTTRRGPVIIKKEKTILLAPIPTVAPGTGSGNKGSSGQAGKHGGSDGSSVTRKNVTVGRNGSSTTTKTGSRGSTTAGGHGGSGDKNSDIHSQKSMGQVLGTDGINSGSVDKNGGIHTQNSVGQVLGIDGINSLQDLQKLGQKNRGERLWSQIILQNLMDEFVKTGNKSLLNEIRKMALEQGIVTPYTSMKSHLSICSPEVTLDPQPIDTIVGTNCTDANIVYPLESLQWFNTKSHSFNINGTVYNVSTTRQETFKAGKCTVTTKKTRGSGICKHFLDCIQSDFKDDMKYYKDNYFCPIQSNDGGAASFFAGVCCLTSDY